MADILVLGATGFTGRLITRYLAHHSERASFTLAAGARSKSKLEALKSSISLDDSVQLLQIDVSQPQQVDEAVSKAKVVVNTIGPYLFWGTEVVRACAKHGVHYVDLSGETPWIRDMIYKYDYLASKTGAAIIPACGFDSVPADLLVLLANKTIKDTLGPDAGLGHSLTVYDMDGGFSGGTLTSLLTLFDDVPPKTLTASRQDYSLSPAIQGARSQPSRYAYTIPFGQPSKYGIIFPMTEANRAIVHRTWGLWAFAEAYPMFAKEDVAAARRRAYGPRFTYAECLKSLTSSEILTSFVSAVILSAFMSLTLSPVRWLAKRVMPQSGEGPSEEVMAKGFLEATNYTSSDASDGSSPLQVKTVMRGRGDPGYLLTSVMISECALALLLDKDALPPLAREGGVLTAASALGEVLVRRLRASGRVEFESKVVAPDGSS